MVGEGEVSGMDEGEEVHFSRVISIAGASSYRLNGKEVGACTRTPGAVALRFVAMMAVNRTYSTSGTGIIVELHCRTTVAV